MAEKQMFCTSCEMYLGKDIKEHYVSEFHKYNCKRKLASLPPILLPEFEAKLKGILLTKKLLRGEITSTCHMTANCARKHSRMSTYTRHISQPKSTSRRRKSSKTNYYQSQTKSALLTIMLRAYTAT